MKRILLLIFSVIIICVIHTTAYASDKRVEVALVGKGTGTTVTEAVGEALSELNNNSNFNSIFEEVEGKRTHEVKEGNVKITITVQTINGKDIFTAYARRNFIFLLKVR